MLNQKTLMITGGTGSFGKTVLNRFLDTDIEQIVIFSRDEKKQEDLRIRLNNSKIKFVIGDVRDPLSISRAMRGVDFVFHAAALKQVPSCEFFPMEATLTNVVGTENVVNAAIDNGVERVVLLSTDKAVYPINAMGISKALAEKVLIAKARSSSPKDPIFCATRYGNVMASRGSVIPLFIDKIKAGTPLTITDPSMTRFMMSLEDSVDLVLHAFTNGEQGDIFVQKAPSCTIGMLSKVLSDMFETPLNEKVIGTRHGEKLFETLISREEMAKAQEMGRYWKIPADNRSLNYDVFITEGSVEANQIDDYTSHSGDLLDEASLKDLLMSLDYVRQELLQFKTS